MIKRIGRYNILFMGESSNDNNHYEMIIITKHDACNNVIADKIFYFQTGINYKIPDFSDIDEVEYYMQFHNYSKFRIKKIYPKNKEDVVSFTQLKKFFKENYYIIQNGQLYYADLDKGIWIDAFEKIKKEYM